MNKNSPLPINDTPDSINDADADKDYVEDMLLTCREIGGTSPGQTHQLACALWGVAISYYRDVRKQAQRSFKAALIASGVGGLFFLVAVILMFIKPWLPSHMTNGGLTASELSLIAGLIVQTISGINFYLYSKTSKQFSAFHACLERSNRFLLTNSMCENLSPESKDAVRAELIRTISSAPLLSEKLVYDGCTTNEENQTRRESQMQAHANGHSPNTIRTDSTIGSGI
jgi:hypothetical protein